MISEAMRTTIYQLFGASGYYTNRPSSATVPPKSKVRENKTNLQHLPIMRIQIHIIRHLPPPLIPPKPPLKLPPHPPQLVRPRPRPRRAQIIAVPEEQVGECGGEAEVGGQQLDDPGAGVEGEALGGEEGGIDFIGGVEDEGLVVGGAVGVL